MARPLPLRPTTINLHPDVARLLHSMAGAAGTTPDDLAGYLLAVGMAAQFRAEAGGQEIADEVQAMAARLGRALPRRRYLP